MSDAISDMEYGAPTISSPNRKKDEVDLVNHPPHYTNHPSGIECIQITEHMNFNLGNAIKYIWRASMKHGIQDLEKAAWYINREIQRMRNGIELQEQPAKESSRGLDTTNSSIRR